MKNTIRQRLAKRNEQPSRPRFRLYHVQLGWYCNQHWGIQNNLFVEPTRPTFSLKKKVGQEWQELAEGSRRQMVALLQQKTHKQPILSNYEAPPTAP